MRQFVSIFCCQIHCCKLSRFNANWLFLQIVWIYSTLGRLTQTFFLQASNSVMARVREHFPPEFINRIDDIVMFNRLTRENIKGIVDLRLNEVKDMLHDRHITLISDEKAISYLANKGYDPVYGARPLRRLVQKEVCK